MIDHSKHIILTLVSALSIMLMMSCADSDFADGYPGEGSLTISLGAPGAMSRAGGQSPDILSPATDDELRVFSLLYFIFPAENNSAPMVKGELHPLPSPEEMANEQFKTYTIKDIRPGKYKVYVVANLPEAANADSESDLKNIILNYSPESLPQPGRLPMVYEPAGVTEIGEKGSTVVANLQFTCVKVRYNIIFSDMAHKVYPGAGLWITDITAHNLSSATPLVPGMPMPDRLTTAKTFDAAMPLGTYHDAWKRDDNPPSGKDVTTPSGMLPGSYADDWVYCGTLYLPERYVADDAIQSYLSIDATIVDSSAQPGVTTVVPEGSKAHYEIMLGHTDQEGQPRQFPRGTYYEIIAEVQTREVIELDAEIKVRDWIPVPMSGFGHTTLTVDKTKAAVSSIDTDSIHYASNASNVTIGCDDNIDGKPLIIQSGHNPATNTLSFTLNPEIPISSFKEGSDFPPEGNTKMWIQANNIRKYIDVYYSVVPLFEVTPLSATIVWLENTPSSPSYTVTFSYRTNLGGISSAAFGNELTSGKSVVSVRCPDTLASVGVFSVTALTDPESTTTHTFNVDPASGSQGMTREINVTVKPPLGDYRIYFRAINDNQGNNDTASTLLRFSGWLPEGDSDNWADGWAGYHHLYAYTQMGETVGGAIPEYNVWRFVGGWPGVDMERDEIHPGWYYHDFAPDAKAVNTEGGHQSTKVIKPGETLFIFSALSDQGVQRHRCTHHLDPGIQLFDYEDREGWYIYDPLCDPYYKIYDEKPVMKDVTYKIYTASPVVKWIASYGHSNTETNPQEFHLGSDAVFSTSEGNWRYTEITAKAPLGDYAKAITLTLESGDETLLFGGDNFYDADDPDNSVGYYLAGQWHKGRPTADWHPSNKHRYYLYDNGASGPFYVHTWHRGTNGDTPLAAWPGVPMTQLEGKPGWWYLEVDGDYDWFIINQRGSANTGDTYTAEKEDIYYEFYNAGWGWTWRPTNLRP